MSPRTHRTTFAALTATVSLGALVAGCGSSSSSSTSSGSASAPAASTSAPATSTSTSAAAPAAAKSGTVNVTYIDYGIKPAKITIKAGQKIKWTSKDATVHNVVFKDGDPEKFKSKDLKQGDTVTYAPKKPGTYSYLCEYHPASMQGTIIVK